MAGISKADIEDIFHRLSELEGTLRALERLVMEQAFSTNFILRGHADATAESIASVISKSPDVLPNAVFLQELRRLNLEMRNIAASAQADPDYPD